MLLIIIAPMQYTKKGQNFEKISKFQKIKKKFIKLKKKKNQKFHKISKFSKNFKMIKF